MRNMDLFAAGVSERPTSDGQLGPTFTCLIGEQFEKIKRGDRFFFRHPDAGFSNREFLGTSNRLYFTWMGKKVLIIY